MRKGRLDYNLEDYIHNFELVDGLHEIGLVTVQDMLRCPLIELLRNVRVIRNWHSYVTTLMSLRDLYFGGKE